MAMRSSDSPRRVYARAGSLVICYGGVYFGPKAETSSAINPEREVKLEVLAPAGGKKRLSVKQAGKNAVSEVWVQKHLTFKSRSATASA